MKTFILVSSLIWTLSALACDPKVSTLTITDPIDGSDFSISIRRYQPKSSEKVPAVFLLPPIVGETFIDRRLAAKFCRNGMAGMILNVVKVLTPEQEVTNLRVHDHSYVRALAGVRAVISDLEKDPTIRPDFGILGMSLGGMLSAYVAGSEPKISASVIIVGAGNVAGVLAHSDQKIVRAQREARMTRFQLKSTEEYEKYLASFITNDPLNVVHNVRPGSMYLFIANSDTTVPTVYQKMLRDAVPEPLVYEMRGNHVTGIVKAGSIHARKITTFLKNSLL